MRISVEPFENDPGKTLHYFDMSARGTLSPGMETLVLDTIDHEHMGVPMSIDVEHQEIYTAREVTMLALLGMSSQKPSLPGFKSIRIKAGRDNPNYGVFTTLGTDGLRIAGQAHGIGLAFRTGVFHPDPEAEQKQKEIFGYIGPDNAELFVQFAPLVAEGSSNKEIAETLGYRKDWGDKWMLEVKRSLDTDKAGLVMIAGGLGLLSNSA